MADSLELEARLSSVRKLHASFEFLQSSLQVELKSEVNAVVNTKETLATLLEVLEVGWNLIEF